MNIFEEVVEELDRAEIHGSFNSPHEGYAVILEELDELKAEVWKNRRSRDYKAMRKEALQVATMGVKFIEMVDCIIKNKEATV